MQEIELLYFDGWPAWPNAWAALGTILSESRIEASVRLRDVTTMALEELDGFAGSPTVRSGGVEPFGYTGPAVMACRRYEDDGGQGWPSLEALWSRLEAARAGVTTSA